MHFRTLIAALAVVAGASAAWGQASNSPETERVVFISGDVVLEDGSLPREAVLIERICKGRAIFAARTDARGHFSFSVEGQGTASAAADASQASPQASDLGKAINSSSTQYTNPITSALRDCEVRAILSGFRAESVPMAMRSASDDGRLGTIVLHPLARSSALGVSATTLAAPPPARKAYERGVNAAGKKEWEAAAGELSKAVKLYPPFSAAWYELGIVRQNRNDIAGASEAWLEARKQDPKFVKPYESLAALADRQQNWTASEQYSREWIQLDPEDFAAAYLINAIANARLDRIEAAEKAARSGVRVDKARKLPRLQYVLGLILMQKQEFEESAKCLRAYLELAPDAHDAAIVREELARIQARAGAGHQH